MSHTVTINFESLKPYINTCENILLDFQKSSQILKNMNLSTKLVDDKINEINKIINELKSSIGSTIDNDYLAGYYHKLSTLEKEVINNTKFVEQLLEKQVYAELDKNNLDYYSKILKYGVLAEATLTYMNQNQIAINETNFERVLNDLRQKEIDEQEREQNLDFCHKYIDSLDFSEKIKFMFKDIANNCITNQEFSDLLPMIKSNLEAKIRTTILINDLVKSFNKQGFIVDKKYGYKENVDTYGNLYYTFILNDSFNHKAEIIVNTNKEIRYKLGNYEGHVCEKTTDKLLKQLEEIGYSCRTIDIKRNVSNEKPLFAQAATFNK